MERHNIIEELEADCQDDTIQEQTDNKQETADFNYLEQ